MTQFKDFHKNMPAMQNHAGVWKGVYTYINHTFEIIDKHEAKVTCSFPASGDYAYIQYNHFTWPDGREYKAQLPAIYRKGRLWWNTHHFHGSAWQTKDDIIVLNLERKDDPGARFFEMITMGETMTNRARTWHWFKDGVLFKRTLCNEWKIT